MPEIPFHKVVGMRESRYPCSPCSDDELGSLLYHASAFRQANGTGRAGIMTYRRAPPSAGGLHPIDIVVVSSDPAIVAIYDPMSHSLRHLEVDTSAIAQRNKQELAEILGEGASLSTTLLFLGDSEKVHCAYENAVSLLWRDAGALLAIFGLYAAALGILGCPIGRLGYGLVKELGFPEPRFVPAGAMVVGTE